jgi:hypothetical protein
MYQNIARAKKDPDKEFTMKGGGSRNKSENCLLVKQFSNFDRGNVTINKTIINSC